MVTYQTLETPQGRVTIISESAEALAWVQFHYKVAVDAYQKALGDLAARGERVDGGKFVRVPCDECETETAIAAGSADTPKPSGER